MEPQAARARHWHCLSPAVPLVPMARSSGLGAEAAAVADLQPWRAARRGRLVDGSVRTFTADRGFAISASHPPDAGTPDLCCRGLDAAPACREAACDFIIAAQDHGDC